MRPSVRFFTEASLWNNGHWDGKQGKISQIETQTTVDFIEALNVSILSKTNIKYVILALLVSMKSLIRLGISNMERHHSK